MPGAVWSQARFASASIERFSWAGILNHPPTFVAVTWAATEKAAGVPSPPGFVAANMADVFWPGAVDDWKITTTCPVGPMAMSPKFEAGWPPDTSTGAENAPTVPPITAAPTA